MINQRVVTTRQTTSRPTSKKTSYQSLLRALTVIKTARQKTGRMAPTMVKITPIYGSDIQLEYRGVPDPGVVGHDLLSSLNLSDLMTLEFKSFRVMTESGEALYEPSMTGRKVEINCAWPADDNTFEQLVTTIWKQS